MSQASSDLDDPFGNAIEANDDQAVAMDADMAAPPAQWRKQGFSIYSVMLILSFVFLMTASIMFFVNAGKF